MAHRCIYNIYINENGMFSYTTLYTDYERMVCQKNRNTKKKTSFLKACVIQPNIKKKCVIFFRSIRFCMRSRDSHCKVRE